MEPNKISVVIVSFRRRENLRQSLSALRLAEGALQVIVVDNNSRDAIAGLDDEFPEIRFNRLQRNFGLTRALNIGIRASDGEYVLLMHDDAEVGGAGVLALAEYLESHPDAGAVCPRFSGPQVRALPTPSNPDPELIAAPAGDEVTVECVSGAAIMVRAAFLKSMGHIDERYGNYGSALEICAQLRSSGRKLVVLGSVPARHDRGASPVPKQYLEGDRIAGTAEFLSKSNGFVAGLLYRVKRSLVALATLRFSALSARKIDGWG